MNEVSIRKQEPSQYKNTINWLNNEKIQRSFGLTREVNLVEHINWLGKHPNIEFLSILHNDYHVGNIVLDFNERHDSVFLQIYIGDTSCRGKGIGANAMNIALDYIFVEKQKHRVHLKVFEDNFPAIKLYEKLGFIKEGIERDSHKMDGVFRNQLLYSMLSKEWKGIH
ncbi:GNAT family N-acetyltransferase [Lysinibacillus odysseyi]|uniref:GNAT family N-acetyltransferase n=1 Tax=Lysinibacillus odysseyi TaxID=202611 RepID=UPI000691A8BE|nr:GNAT family N-acetyltransferase [Lysinibacillus odysseyi]